MNPVQIDILSDLVCPWCYIGRRRLEDALTQIPEVETQIHWQPFELFPQIPVSGVERHTHMAQVFGSARRRDAVFAEVARTGQAEGIDLRFDTILHSPNTFLLHRLLWKAGQQGYQDALAMALFKAFFTENRDLTQRTQLDTVLAPFGWSPTQLDQFLTSHEGAATVRHQQRLYRFAGITSVPTYIFNNQIMLVGAQPPEQFVKVITQAARIAPLPAEV
ncbi:DsbA family oxidoreductase [Spirosoma soli]|uniref:DsbA family oxidoreductase n=1 Tax=Spirosoma soli TaxID=1770529 RepID=A0ABW5M2M9_9BACT